MISLDIVWYCPSVAHCQGDPMAGSADSGGQRGGVERVRQRSLEHNLPHLGDGGPDLADGGSDLVDGVPDLVRPPKNQSGFSWFFDYRGAESGVVSHCSFYLRRAKRAEEILL